MTTLRKSLVLFATFIFILAGCATGSGTKTLEDTPYYEMLSDVKFTNNQRPTEKSFVLKKGSTVVGKLTASGDVEIYFDSVPYIATSKKIKGTQDMDAQAMILMISVDQIEILKNVDILDRDGDLLAHTKTDLVPMHYMREFTMEDGKEYYELNLAGNLAYVLRTDAKLHLSL